MAGLAQAVLGSEMVLDLEELREDTVTLWVVDHRGHSFLRPGSIELYDMAERTSDGG